MTGKINIGRIIKDTLKSRNMSIAEFAESINCTERNVYKIFNKPSIDTEMLRKINQVLGKNLFVNYIPSDEVLDIIISKNKETELTNVIKDLASTVAFIKTLKKENSKTK
jgi:transcriptional regulator with XRE-family HTH domain